MFDIIYNIYISFFNDQGIYFEIIIKIAMNQNGNMNINEFKGIYYNDNKQQKFFEGGAHFSYKALYHLLENLQCLKEKSDSTLIVKSERMKVIYLISKL